MNTPHPYREKRKGDRVVREFSAGVSSEELVWHQDRRQRQVKVLEGKGWRLQLDHGLPFPLVEGNTYNIPARSWHRVIRGSGNLVIEISENSMKTTESILRRVIRESMTDQVTPPPAGGKLPDTIDPLYDVENPDTPKGGTWGIPGASQTAAIFRQRFQKPGLYDIPRGKVKPWEADKIAQRVAQVKPDELIAYSRGAAAYNLTKAMKPGAIDDIPVTYVAPSSYRKKWTGSTPPVTPAPAGSKVLIGDKDKIVPYKQACKNAVEADADMYVLPGFSHVGIMYSHGEVTPGSFEVDAKSCAADPEMPDWGDAPPGTRGDVCSAAGSGQEAHKKRGGNAPPRSGHPQGSSTRFLIPTRVVTS